MSHEGTMLLENTFMQPFLHQCVCDACKLIEWKKNHQDVLFVCSSLQNRVQDVLL